MNNSESVRVLSKYLYDTELWFELSDDYLLSSDGHTVRRGAPIAINSDNTNRTFLILCDVILRHYA